MYKPVVVVMFLVAMATGLETIYDFKLNDIQGNPVDFQQYKGKTLLIVNVASQCGQTDSHYKALKRLYDILSFSGKFEILAFPCNDFGEQEPWDDKEIEEFVRQHFKAEFPLFQKQALTDSPFWQFVIGKTGVSPSWNFQKYLFSKTGDFIQTWDSNVSIEAIFDNIQTIINQQEEDIKKHDDEQKTEL